MHRTIRRVAACATGYDPTTFLVGVAAWGVFTGISLLLPGAAFDASPVYGVVRGWWLSEDQWGEILLLDAAALLGSIAAGARMPTVERRRALAPVRGAVAILSGLLWALWGGLLLAGAAGLANGWGGIAAHGFFSAAGAWTVFAAIGCWLAAVQWVAPASGGEGG